MLKSYRRLEMYRSNHKLIMFMTTHEAYFHRSKKKKTILKKHEILKDTIMKCPLALKFSFLLLFMYIHV